MAKYLYQFLYVLPLCSFLGRLHSCVVHIMIWITIKSCLNQTIIQKNGSFFVKLIVIIWFNIDGSLLRTVKLFCSSQKIQEH